MIGVIGETMEPGRTALDLSRRGFLVRGVTGSAVLGALGCLPGAGGDAAALLGDGVRLLRLPRRPAGVLAAALRRVIPPREGSPSVDEVDLVGRIDRELYFQPDAMVRDLLDALRVLEWWPVLTGRFARFSALEVGAQDRVLEGMARSRFDLVRSSFSGIRMLGLFYYYAAESTWPAIGYDGTWAAPNPPETARYVARADAEPRVIDT
jgi:hypothetical protein